MVFYKPFKRRFKASPSLRYYKSSLGLECCAGVGAMRGNAGINVDSYRYCMVTITLRTLRQVYRPTWSAVSFDAKEHGFREMGALLLP